MKPHAYKPRFLELLCNRPSGADIGREAAAGLTVGLIALPLALALGIASIPVGADTPYSAPALGIYTAIIAGFLISVFGGSRVQIGGPTAAFIPIVLLIVQAHGYVGLLLATMMAGIILILMGFARLGTLIKYIPWPVTSGFTTGIAVAIMVTQVVDFSGIHGETAIPGEFFEKVEWLCHHLGTLDAMTVLVALLSCAVIFFWPRIGWKRLPGSIVAMLLGTLAVWGLNQLEGVQIATVGSRFGDSAIPAHLPSFMMPAVSVEMIRELIMPATAIAILCSIESLLSAVVADGLTNQRHDSNSELIGQGIANLICPFFGGLPATGAIARTSANIRNGGRTPLAGVVHALSLLAIVLLFSSFARYIPMPTMAAVLVMVALHMGEWRALKEIKRMQTGDALVLLTTFALTVIFDLVVAIEIGMVLAALLFIRRVSETTEVSRVTHNDVLESPEHVAQGKAIPEGVLVYRIFGPFLFGAADKMQDALEELSDYPKVIILRMHLVTAMDTTALYALVNLVERMRERGTSIVVSGIHRQPLELLRKSDSLKTLGIDNFCGHYDEALNRAQQLIAESK
ncbi:SulP family inorganic anion transporter [Coraliomargarita algicola]|uniref:SulP family inorganic anion transporter n=1 Tax=Coraliomargarita algicola TaxID=3092156 RepID=A0ABZ0RMD7_9BACT|nr:SulP family inorganic anion transporter [Coraliomargarita sp. J2-16]WPJ94099.1 SulP family inorganic anion transporter [Coraliomargarita sp. J2-16]